MARNDLCHNSGFAPIDIKDQSAAVESDIKHCWCGNDINLKWHAARSDIKHNCKPLRAAFFLHLDCCLHLSFGASHICCKIIKWWCYQQKIHFYGLKTKKKHQQLQIWNHLYFTGHLNTGQHPCSLDCSLSQENVESHKLLSGDFHNLECDRLFPYDTDTFPWHEDYVHYKMWNCTNGIGNLRVMCKHLKWRQTRHWLLYLPFRQQW